MALKIVISSYAGLLLLACIYPVLISLKIRPITTVCALSLIALDYDPKDGNSINMADMVGQSDNVVGLFLNYQIYKCDCLCCSYCHLDSFLFCLD